LLALAAPALASFATPRAALAAAGTSLRRRSAAGTPARGWLKRRLQERRAEQLAVYEAEPKWASWKAPELHARDGWTEEGSWMSRILNSRRLSILHDGFQRLRAQSERGHHWVMVIDLRKCIGCHACTVACKSANNVPVGVYRTWVQVIETGTMEPHPDGSVLTEAGAFEPGVHRFSLPRLCNHCDNPPCVEVCPVQATFKREDGSGVSTRVAICCWGR